MAAKKAGKQKTLKATWERGYNGHSLWQGKSRIGKVTVHAGRGEKHKYTWQAASKAGAAGTLAEAKKAVEFAALVATRQRDLFE